MSGRRYVFSMKYQTFSDIFNILFRSGFTQPDLVYTEKKDVFSIYHRESNPDPAGIKAEVNDQ